MVRPLTLTLALAAFVACASNQQYSSSSAGGSVDLSAYPIPALSGSELQLLHGMSDSNILGHLATVDSIEIVTADSALRLSKSDAVLQYAAMMRAAHTANLNRDKEISDQTHITRTTVFGELKNKHLTAQLDSVRFGSDYTIDRHYIMSQVELHQHVLAELEALQGVAQNPMIRDQIASMIPVVRDHLSRAHALAVERGFEKKRG